MGYSDNVWSVRVDFFRCDNGGLGRWYCTEAVLWLHYGGPSVYDAFAAALDRHLRNPDRPEPRLQDMIAICLEPYHQNAHPVAMSVRDALTRVERDPALRTTGSVR